MARRPRIRRRDGCGEPTSAEQLAAMRKIVRSGATDRPGVYRMLSADGEVLYVGKSKRVRTRLLSYFRCAFPAEKGARILREASAIDWEYTPSEFSALLQEMRLIKRFRPRFNVAMMRDARHYAFIRLTSGAAPKLAVVRGAGSEEGDSFYGPFQGAQRLGEAVRELSDALGLRDCAATQRMHFSDQPELFDLSPRTPGCIRFEIRKCLGPCVGGCSVREYAERVALARAFLDGANDGPMQRLRADMEASSERLEFERAASLRDKLQRLELLREQFSRLRFAVETLSFIYTVRGHNGDDRVYLIRRGRVRAERPAPSSAKAKRELRRIAEEIYTPSTSAPLAVPAHEIDELLLLSAWFRRNPAELERTTPA